MIKMASWTRVAAIAAIFSFVGVSAKAHNPVGYCANNPQHEHCILTDESYVLGPGDEINIVVYNQKELSGSFSVNKSGTISFHFVGEIQATGRTIDAVLQDYSDHLADGFLVDPRVSGNISKYRPVFVIGAVNRPGAYPYQIGLDISRVIALAGGHHKRANKGTPPLLKRGRGATVSAKSVSVDTLVLPGDTVEVPTCRKIECAIYKKP